MYNTPFPYIPPQFNNNYEEEIKKIYYEIQKLKEKLNKLEKEKPDYLKKDDGLYII